MTWDGPLHLSEPVAPVYESLPSFIDRDWLDGEHPLQYGKSGELLNRCPRCEEWSPCRVRIMFELLDRGLPVKVSGGKAR